MQAKVFKVKTLPAQSKGILQSKIEAQWAAGPLQKQQMVFISDIL